MDLKLSQMDEQAVTLEWTAVPGAARYDVDWTDRISDTVQPKRWAETTQTHCVFRKSGHRPYYLRVTAVAADGALLAQSEMLETPVRRVLKPQLEELGRGLVAVKTKTGVFLSWRLLRGEVNGWTQSGLAGMDFVVYKNGALTATVTDSTNWLDTAGTLSDRYAVAPCFADTVYPACSAVTPNDSDHFDLPLQKPADGVTPAGKSYTYRANDLSVADVDGDGEYEYLVKWDPDNSQDVSIKGYTGRCFIDCYRLSGALLWRLDMGVNIRAGAHYTQFMAYDFDGDGHAELAVKTAPGTKMTRFAPDGTVLSERYITMPQADLDAGYSHADNYVCSAADYRAHMAKVFRAWGEHPEVKAGHWPKTLEECFGIPVKYAYPLSQTDAEALADYFIADFAPSRSARNHLEAFEGFIYEGPEYLTMFGGDGRERDTIPFKFGRVDDGLLWGDYALPRIEPCNRVDRFLSGVAYLDGERPYLIIGRGYYTRTTLVAYDFFTGKFHETWSVDSGFVPMENPFCDNPHEPIGSDPVFGRLAGQGNHSLSTADVDGDGCMEVVYGAAVIDHDGSLLYSSFGNLPDGRRAKFGHGDAMHVADINPDRPGFEIFNVFEGAQAAPYGYALRDAETGEAYFGEYAEEDLGRCMVGDMVPGVRGLQVWVNDVYDCKGNRLEVEVPGTNARIYWAADLTTQVTDGKNYLVDSKCGAVNDLTHGCMLKPEGTLTNNGTKGNPGLIADVFGDFREELLLRTEDSSAIRIYTATELAHHKLMTLMHDPMYRCGVAWQNNCYNQPGYPSFYYASDMDFKNVMPEQSAKPTVYLAGDSTMQSYAPSAAPQTGWGEVLAQQLAGAAVCRVSHREDCPFGQETRYELPGLVLDNCAMAGRSSRSFREEGRLADIEAHLKPGDFLLVQFAHNDAYREKEERFVPVDAFGASLGEYAAAARRHGAQCVLVSPIAMRDFDENGVCRVSFAEYRAAMQRFAQENELPFIDLGAATAQQCTTLGAEKCKQVFLWVKPGAYPESAWKDGCEDNAHLQRAGAQRFAALFAQLLRESEDPRLALLRRNLRG